MIWHAQHHQRKIVAAKRRRPAHELEQIGVARVRHHRRAARERHPPAREITASRKRERHVTWAKETYWMDVGGEGSTLAHVADGWVAVTS
jgi:hypothetical protein